MRFLLSSLLFILPVASFGQSPTVSASKPWMGGKLAQPVIPCTGNPGNTLGFYTQQCQTSAGSIFACNNVDSCHLAADWKGGASSGSSVSLAGVTNSVQTNADGTNLGGDANFTWDGTTLLIGDGSTSGAVVIDPPSSVNPGVQIGPPESSLDPYIRSWQNNPTALVTGLNNSGDSQSISVEGQSSGSEVALSSVGLGSSGVALGLEAITNTADGNSYGIELNSGARGSIVASQTYGMSIANVDLSGGASSLDNEGIQVQDLDGNNGGGVNIGIAVQQNTHNAADRSFLATGTAPAEFQGGIIASAASGRASQIGPPESDLDTFLQGYTGSNTSLFTALTSTFDAGIGFELQKQDSNTSNGGVGIYVAYLDPSVANQGSSALEADYISENAVGVSGRSSAIYADCNTQSGTPFGCAAFEGGNFGNSFQQSFAFYSDDNSGPTLNVGYFSEQNTHNSADRAILTAGTALSEFDGGVLIPQPASGLALQAGPDEATLDNRIDGWTGANSALVTAIDGVALGVETQNSVSNGAANGIYGALIGFAGGSSTLYGVESDVMASSTVDATAELVYAYDATCRNWTPSFPVADCVGLRVDTFHGTNGFTQIAGVELADQDAAATNYGVLISQMPHNAGDRSILVASGGAPAEFNGQIIANGFGGETIALQAGPDQSTSPYLTDTFDIPTVFITSDRTSDGSTGPLGLEVESHDSDGNTFESIYAQLYSSFVGNQFGSTASFGFESDGATGGDGVGVNASCTAGATAASNLGTCTGLQATVLIETGSAVGSVIAAHLHSPSFTSGGSATNAIGLLVDDQTEATNNHAIQTGQGPLSWGDVVEQNPFTYAELILMTVPNGTQAYCADCKNFTDDVTGTWDSPVASSGHGTNAVFENSQWRVH